MKKFSFLISIVLLFNLLAACTSNGLPPTADAHAVETMFAGTLAALPTNTPPSTETPVPQASSTQVLPASTSTSDPASEINWVVFHDPDLQITFEYPQGWSLTPAVEVEKGGVIIIVSPVDSAGKSYNINIGQHFNETIGPQVNLLDWTTARDSNDGMIDPGARVMLSRESMNISGLDAVYTVMGYPEVRYVNIRRNDKVLFIWANIGESADIFYQNIYAHVLMSFVSD